MVNIAQIRPTNVTLQTWMNEDKTVGLEMRLERDVHYAGFKPGNVISIFGLDKSGENTYDVVCTEHYKPEDLMRAMNAFEERLASNNPLEWSSKIYSTFHSLDQCLERKVKETV